MPFRRDAERFESVVDRTAASAGGGADTRVFVASVGTLAETNARATWVGHFLRVGGFEPIDDGPYADPEAAAAAFAASGARSAVINAPDAAYPNLVPALAPSLSAAGARRILLAGRPSTPNAGVDEAIHVGSDVRGALLRLLESLEVM